MAGKDDLLFAVVAFDRFELALAGEKIAAVDRALVIVIAHLLLEAALSSGLVAAIGSAGVLVIAQFGLVLALAIVAPALPAQVVLIDTLGVGLAAVWQRLEHAEPVLRVARVVGAPVKQRHAVDEINQIPT